MSEQYEGMEGRSPRGGLPGGEADHPDAWEHVVPEGDEEKIGGDGRSSLPTTPAPRRRGRRTVKAVDAERRQFTPAERLLILSSWQKSSLSARDFAPLVGVAPHTLYQWKRLFVSEFGHGYSTYSDANGVVLLRKGGVVWGVPTRPSIRETLPRPGTLEVRSEVATQSSYDEVQTAIYLGSGIYYTPRSGVMSGPPIGGAELHTQEEYYEKKPVPSGTGPVTRPLTVPYAGAGIIPQIGRTVDDFGMTLKLLLLLRDYESSEYPILMSAQ